MDKTVEEVIRELELEIKEINIKIENYNLTKLGLTEKVYSDKPNNEYNMSEYVDNKFRYFKIITKDISEEEKLKVYKLLEEKNQLEKILNDKTNKQNNGISELLFGLGLLIYFICFIFGLVILFDNTANGLLVWFGGLFSGSIFLGFGEIIKLLDKISKK